MHMFQVTKIIAVLKEAKNFKSVKDISEKCN